MKKFLLFLPLLLIVWTIDVFPSSGRTATSTINNFTISGGVYSFDVWTQSTGTTTINVGTSSLFFSYNRWALSNPTLTNINPKYTGQAGVGNYDPMTVGIVARKIAVTIFFTGNMFGISSMSSTDERICTVNLTITPPSQQANLSWDILNSAWTNAIPLTYVMTTWVGSDNSSLPIQLASFTATVVNQNEVRVDWTTLTETNNYGFEVEKSAETTNNYQTIPNSFVPGHGTTVQPHSYSYTDVTASSGLWFYRLKQIDLDGTVHYTEGVQVDVTTGVEEKPIPSEFALDQNYPNPFNPSTQIQFALPQTSHVKLEIYNGLGERIATLVDETRQAGYHSERFDGTGLASGLYFYRLQAGDFVDTKKLLLLK